MSQFHRAMFSTFLSNLIQRSMYGISPIESFAPTVTTVLGSERVLSHHPQ